jgi:hypothetical protein
MNAPCEATQGKLLIAWTCPGGKIRAFSVFSQGIGINLIGFTVFRSVFAQCIA